MRSLQVLMFCAGLACSSGCGPREEPVAAAPPPEPVIESSGLDERWNPPPDERLEARIREFEQRLVDGPDDAAVHHDLGLALRSARRREEALRHLARAVELEPTDDKYRMDLALIYSSVARLDEAAAIYRSLLDSPGLRPIALHNLGNVESRRGDLDQAIEYYRQALEVKADYLLAHYHLGLALQERGDVVEAYASFGAVMRIPPSQDRAIEAARFDALHRMASLDLAEGRPEQAVALLERLLQFYPDHPNANFTYGRALTLLGRHEEGRRAFERHERVPRRSEGRIGFIGVADEPPAAAGAALDFRDVTNASGIDYLNVCGATPTSDKGWATESIGAGAAWLDYNGDGNLDLYLVNGSAHERASGAGEPDLLYRGDGHGHFEDVTAVAGIDNREWGYGVAVGDIDNDGDSDLYVTNYGPNVLYRNDGNGRFSDVTAAVGVGDSAWGTSSAFFDMDNDGDLDLYVANYLECGPDTVPRRGQTPFCAWKGIDVACGPKGLDPFQDVLYRNDGDDGFTDVTLASGVWLDEPRYALGVVTLDFDNDGDQDVYVANDSMQNSLWRNDGDGRFTDIGVISMAAYNADGDSQSGMGTASGDFNGDGWMDLVVTNFSHDLNTLYRNVEGRYFLDESSTIGLGITNLALSWGAGFRDFDLDGHLDLFIANGHIFPEVDDYDVGSRYRQANQLFRNTGDGHFRDVSAEAGPGLAVLRSFRGAAFGDYDNDGDADVVLTALDERLLLLENATATAGHWLELALVGRRSNRDGVGARVTVVAAGRRLSTQRTGGSGFLSADDPRLHFGLGAAGRVDRIEVLWPSGTRDTLRDVDGDRVVTITEGSSPPEE